MFIVIGSSAAEQLGLASREVKDFDVLTSREDETGYSPLNGAGKRVDALVVPALEKYAWENPNGYATLDELYTIKLSHGYWKLKNDSWKKHTFDLVQFARAGAKEIPELHSLLYAHWELIHGKKKANLELSPDEFFNAHVDRVYDHDSIHASVAYYQEEGPLFNRILRDNHQVAVDRSKFEAMSQEDKLKLVREEVYATALERRLIPKNYRMSKQAAYDYALTQTITSYTKGWFPRYILNNYDELRRPDKNFVAWHLENKHKLVPLAKKAAAEV